ncbi:MAG: Ig-like domain-containing protein, partial [Planctomycetota bacterium]
MRRALVAVVVVALGVAWWLRDGGLERREAGRRTAERTTPSRAEPVEEQPAPPAVPSALPRLDVTVTDVAGSPREGIAVALRGSYGGASVAGAFTDAHGRVRFEQRAGTPLLRVHADPLDGTPEVFGGHWRPDPRNPKSMRIVLPGPLELNMRVTVDGAPGIPKGFDLLVPALRNEVRDEASGTIRGSVRAEGHMFDLDVFAPDLVLMRKPVAFRSGEACWAQVDFSRALSVTIRIRGNTDFSDHIVLQRRYGERSWDKPLGETEFDFEHDDDLAILGHQVAAGSYRVVTRPGGLVLEEFELTPDMRETTIELDLRDAALLDVTVVVPDGYEHPGRLAYELVETGRILTARRQEILHPGDRPLTIRASGPWLIPHPKRGTLRTRRGGKVELQAAPAPLVHVRGPHVVPALSIALWKNGVMDRTVPSAYPVIDGFAFNAPPKGRYDVVIYAWKHAPTLLRDVLLGPDLAFGHEWRPVSGSVLTVLPRGLPSGTVPQVFLR